MAEQKKTCPLCGSSDTLLHEEEPFLFLKCNTCKYDESTDHDEAYPEQRSKGGKGSPYKRGGAQRSANIKR